MKKKAIIYLHGFNSASLDKEGNLLTNKAKLRILQDFCLQKDVAFFAPNVDYRDFTELVEDMLRQWNHFLDQGHDVVFMGSSMGGFACTYLAMKTLAPAILINPVLSPTQLLAQFIGVSENYETGEPYQWTRQHCDHYAQFEQEIDANRPIANLFILLDMDDELLDSSQTVAACEDSATVTTFKGGSHSFEHMTEALPVVEQVLFDR